LRAGVVPEDYPESVAQDYPDCLEIVRNKVLPERTRHKEDGSFALRYPLYLKWWIYAEKRPALYAAVRGMDRILLTSLINNHLGFVFAPVTWVFAHKLCVFPLDQIEDWAVLQSSIHYCWAWNYSSTNLALLNYSPSDCFETFPFPQKKASLIQVAETYYEYRRQLMLRRQEGLTKTYNRFHNVEEKSTDIVELRGLHSELDKAVVAAYGWTDIDLCHGFHQTKQGPRFTISESVRHTILDRLLAVNHQHHEEEVSAGLHEKKSKSALRKRTSKDKVNKNVAQAGFY